MPDYAQMSQLTKVSVELEDCFGVGIYRFLQMVGHQLTELSLSCSSGKQKKFLWTNVRLSVSYRAFLLILPFNYLPNNLTKTR